jgi:hypothetical protein
MKTIFVAEETVNQYDSGVDIVGVYDTQAAEFAIDMYGYRRNADIREYEVTHCRDRTDQKDYHALLAKEKEERVAQSKRMDEESKVQKGLTRL